MRSLSDLGGHGWVSLLLPRNLNVMLMWQHGLEGGEE